MSWKNLQVEKFRKYNEEEDLKKRFHFFNRHLYEDEKAESVPLVVGHFGFEYDQKQHGWSNLNC